MDTSEDPRRGRVPEMREPLDLQRKDSSRSPMKNLFLSRVRRVKLFISDCAQVNAEPFKSYLSFCLPVCLSVCL